MATAKEGSREDFWLAAWYQGRWWLWLLWPLSMLYRGLASWRRKRLSRSAAEIAATVIVVGNISLGGTGKTPLIIAMARYLQQRGLRPGVLSRGYGGQAPQYPFFVTPDCAPQYSGDEPLLIAREADCPVVVDSDRVAAAQCLVRDYDCNVLLSDDGMQHYRLQRQWEIAVVDGSRGLGNGLCLPAGPLREPPERLRQVDCVVVNGAAGRMSAAEYSTPVFAVGLQPAYWCNLHSGERVPLDQRPWPFEAQGVEAGLHAITGIGNPERFFRSLRDMGLSIRENSFPDHHPFCAGDLRYVGSEALLMTAKDAVKCQSFAGPDWWYLSVDMQMPDEFYRLLDEFLSRQGLLAASV